MSLLMNCCSLPTWAASVAPQSLPKSRSRCVPPHCLPHKISQQLAPRSRHHFRPFPRPTFSPTQASTISGAIGFADVDMALRASIQIETTSGSVKVVCKVGQQEQLHRPPLFLLDRSRRVLPPLALRHSVLLALCHCTPLESSLLTPQSRTGTVCRYHHNSSHLVVPPVAHPLLCVLTVLCRKTRSKGCTLSLPM